MSRPQLRSSTIRPMTRSAPMKDSPTPSTTTIPWSRGRGFRAGEQLRAVLRNDGHELFRLWRSVQLGRGGQFFQGAAEPEQSVRFQVWAYNANDLLAVKNGTLQPWQVQPYDVWKFNVPVLRSAAAPRSAAWPTIPRQAGCTFPSQERLARSVACQ